MFGDSWEISNPDEALRLNVATISSGGSEPLIKKANPSIIELLPKIGTSAVKPEHASLLATQQDFVPQNNFTSISWASIDGDNDSVVEAMSTIPYCQVKNGTKVDSRSAAWEFVYECLRGLASKSLENGEPGVARLLGPNQASLYAIEPVLDLEEKNRDKKYEFFNDKGKENALSADGEPQFKEASAVWPTGELGWHLGDQYSELSKAFKEVFPDGLGTKGKVVIAHLDTGYFPEDPLLPSGFNKDLSYTCSVSGCVQGGEANWRADGITDSPGHGAHTLSNLAGKQYMRNKIPHVMGGNPNANVFSINIHDSVIHLDSRRMARGIEQAVSEHADLITLSHGGMPSIRLATAVNSAYFSGTPIFAATGDYYDYLIGTTFVSTVFPARYPNVMGVAGITKDEKSYGESPSIWWWLDFGKGYTSRIGSWMLRGSYGPTSVMSNGKVISAYVPNITRSDAEKGRNNVIASDGAGTSNATPQVAAAASLWLEKNRESFIDEKCKDEKCKEAKWRSWEKSEAVYQALSSSSFNCFPDYNVEHYGVGILRANRALAWTYKSAGDKEIGVLEGPKSEQVKLVQRDMSLFGIKAPLISAVMAPL